MIILVSKCVQSDPVLIESNMLFDGTYKGKKIKGIKITNRALLKGRDYLCSLEVKEIKNGFIHGEWIKGKTI